MEKRRFSRGSWSLFLLGVAAALMAVLLWQGVSSPPPAYAQVPDSGAQRKQMIAELRTANRKLTQIAEILREIRDAQAGAKPGKSDKKSGVAPP